MKGVLEIRKLLWAANLISLAILGYVVAGFILGNDAEHSTIVEPAPQIVKGEITLSKDPILLDNHKIIMERNIFGSVGTGTDKENLQKEKKEAPAPVLRAQLRLLATVAGDEEVACAVIENIKTKIQDLYKTGDIIEGAQVERIERNRIVLFNRGQREVLNLYVADGVSVPVAKSAEPVMAQKKPSAAEIVTIISPTEREINKKAFLAKVGGTEAILRTVDAAPYIVNGKEKGIRITGLEDLSMARYIGFENGDVIQNINGSTVTNRRKAFQILRKVRSQSSLNIQLLRNKKKKELLFGIK